MAKALCTGQRHYNRVHYNYHNYMKYFTKSSERVSAFWLPAILVSLHSRVKRKVLNSFFLNNKTVLERHISKGTVFQIFGAHNFIEKALSPYMYVLVLQVGCISRS